MKVVGTRRITHHKILQITGLNKRLKYALGRGRAADVPHAHEQDFCLHANRDLALFRGAGNPWLTDRQCGIKGSRLADFFFNGCV